MTRLQKDLFDALEDAWHKHQPMHLAAEVVAKRYIEKAYDAGQEYGEQWNERQSDEYRVITVPDKTTFMKENGIEDTSAMEGLG